MGWELPRPDYALLGAVIEDERGNVVAKMVGPEKLIKKSKSLFAK